MRAVRLHLALAILALTSCQRNPSLHWVATWATAPVNIPTNFVPEGFLRPAFVNFHFTLKNETARAVVHTTIGGDRVRVHISNRFGTAPLVIGSAHAALRESETAIRAGSDRTLTFSTKPSATIPAGAELVSDAAALSVPALADLAISIYFPNEAAVTTTHVLAVQTSYIAPGDKTDATSLDAAAKITSWPFLVGVEVTPAGAASAAVAFGDSITDGMNSQPDANHRWPDLLAARLAAQHRQVSVLNAGIAANRILHEGVDALGLFAGMPGVARFDRDVLAHAGVSKVIVLLGINDIGMSGQPGEPEVPLVNLQEGLRQLADRAHRKSLRIYGATLLPFEGTANGYYTPAKEQIRQGLNGWIRTSRVFDSVIDFDAAVRDPQHTGRILALYDSGDHLHPNDAGYRAMGEAVDLKLFQ